MSIDGITNPKPAYPRLGKLRKGSPKKTVKSKKTGKMIEVVGDDLDHFRFDTENEAARVRFHEVYGAEPREINVRLPFATKDENFDAWMKEYAAGGLKRKCGRPESRENGVVLWQDESGAFQTAPKICLYPDCDCKPYGVLTVIIPELVPVAGIGLIWVLTTSWNDCAELSRNLVAAEDSARGLGMDLRGIPFILSRRLDDVSTPPRKEGGTRVRDEKWMLHIEPHPDWVASQIQAFQQLASPMRAIAALSAPATTLTPQDEIFMENGGWNSDEEEVEHPETEVLDEPEPVVEEQPQAGNGTWPARPWDPETCRAALNKAVEKVDPGRKALKTHQKAALIALNKLVLGDGEKRHKLTWFLFGVESSKELTAEQCAVITDKWAKVGPPEFEPVSAAVEETQRILEALGFEEMPETEQEELPF